MGFIEQLRTLKNTANCFVMEMDSWDQRFLGEGWVTSPIYPLGNMANQFPIYFIMKGGMHYYCIWATEAWEFTLVHSMGYSIHNSFNFPEKRFFDIIECLKTSLV